MIREAVMSERDIGGIQRLVNIGVEKGRIQPRTHDEIVAIIEQRHFWVADHVMGIAGCIALEVYSPTLAEIRSLVVINERHRELGKDLVARVVEEARRLGIRDLLTITDRIGDFELNEFEILKGQTPMFLRLTD